MVLDAHKKEKWEVAHEKKRQVEVLRAQRRIYII